MPKRMTVNYQPEETPPPPPVITKAVVKTDAPLTHEEKMERTLAEIALHVKRMERRDHWRYIGGYFRTFLHIIPLAILLGSLWYVYEHGEDLLKTVVEEAAKRAAQYSAGGLDAWMDQVRQFLPTLPPK